MKLNRLIDSFTFEIFAEKGKMSSKESRSKRSASDLISGTEKRIKIDVDIKGKDEVDMKNVEMVFLIDELQSEIENR